MPPTGKRKRASSPTGGPAVSHLGGLAAQPLQSASTSKKSRLNDGTASDAAGKVEVVYELVGSEKTCTRDMTDKSLDDAVVGVARGLGIPFLGLRFTHVRSTGVETDVWDDFDFKTIRERAIAQGSHTEKIRVYSGALGQAPAPSPAHSQTSFSFSPANNNAHSTPGPSFTLGSGSISSLPPSSMPTREPAPTPRSALRSPASERSNKRVSLALPGRSPPSTPSPATASNDVSKSRSQKRKKRKERRHSELTVPTPVADTPPSSSSAITAPPSPSPNMLSRIESIAAKHKPARPSPLNPSAESSKDKGKGKEKEKEQQSKRRRKSQPLPPVLPPVVGTLPPVVGTLPPVVGTLSPVAGTLPPVVGTVQPAQSASVEAPPAEETGGSKSKRRRARKSLVAEPAPTPVANGAEKQPAATEPAPVPTPIGAEKEATSNMAAEMPAPGADSSAEPSSKKTKKAKKRKESSSPWNALIDQMLAQAQASTPEKVPASESATSASIAKATASSSSALPKNPEPVQEPAPAPPKRKGKGKETAPIVEEPALVEPVEGTPEESPNGASAESTPSEQSAEELAVDEIAENIVEEAAVEVAPEEAPAAKAVEKATDEPTESTVGKPAQKDATSESPSPSPAPAEETPKRHAAPRKASHTVQPAEPSPAASKPSNAKRALRPRKSTEADEGAAQPADAPKKRGRPKKVIAAEEPAPVPVAAESTEEMSLVEIAVEEDPSVNGSADVVQPTAVEEADDIPVDEAMDVDESPVDDAPNGHVDEERPPSAYGETEIESAPSVDEAEDAPEADETLAAIDEASRGSTAALLDPENCLLCQKVADHPTKECPVVQEGVKALRKRLRERRVELKPADGRSRAVRTDAVVEMCNQWITRLTKIASAVVDGVPPKKSGTSQPAAAAVPSSQPKPVVEPSPSPAEEREEPLVEDAAPSSQPKPAMPPSSQPKPPVSIPSSQSKPAALSTSQATPKPLTAAARFAAANGVRSPATPRAAEEEDVDSSEDDVTPGPIKGQSAPGTPDTPFYPQSLHLMAAARSKRPGSSRLSVSDAVIETGDSDESSSDSDANSDSESDDDSITGSDSDSDSAGSDVDAEELLRKVMSAPLSSRQRAAAARSAATMHTVSQEDIVDADSLSDDDDEIIPPRATQRAGSESSIGDFAEDDSGHLDDSVESDDADVEEKSRLLTQVVANSQAAPAAAAKDADAMDVDEVEESEEEIYSEDEEPKDKGKRPMREPSTSPLTSPPKSVSRPINGPRRSFVRMMSSPVLDNLPGDIALREAIKEDDGIILDGPARADLPATQTAQVLRTSAPSSPPISLLNSKPVSKASSTGSRDSAAPSKAPSDYSPSPSPPPKRRGRPPKNASAPASQPTRRSARAVSQEPEVSASQPSGRVTRARVASNSHSASAGSNSSPRRVVTALPSKGKAVDGSEEVDDEDTDVDATPRASQRRIGFPSSKTQSSRSLGLQSNGSMEEPPAAQRRNDSLSSLASHANSPLRRRGRQPLFMTQPSQMPATQVYNSMPPPLLPESSEPAEQPENGHASDSDSASDDSGSNHSDNTSVVPALPSMRSSQPPPITASFPTLSSLPKDLLRHGASGVRSVFNRVTGAGTSTESQADPDSDSSSDSDDSSDEEGQVPAHLRARIAGGSRSAKKPNSRGVMKGW